MDVNESYRFVELKGWEIDYTTIYLLNNTACMWVGIVTSTHTWPDGQVVQTRFPIFVKGEDVLPFRLSDIHGLMGWCEEYQNEDRKEAAKGQGTPLQ